MEEKKILIRVKCPNCGYVMPIRYTPGAHCTGVFVTCKGRNCRKTFEINIKNGEQVK